MGRYRVVGPYAVDEHPPGSVFDADLQPDRARRLYLGGHIEPVVDAGAGEDLVAVTRYRVVGDRSVDGYPPGSVFDSDMPAARARRLAQAGYIHRVDDVDPLPLLEDGDLDAAAIEHAAEATGIPIDEIHVPLGETAELSTHDQEEA